MNASSDSHRQLGTIQRWMLATIMHPAGVSDGMASEEARRHIDVGPEHAERVIERSKALTAIERLDIYGRAYFARLLDCLREEFPVLKQALGEDVFNGFAAEYLERYPSRSYTLFHLGLNFPRFLAETRPDRDENRTSATAWPDFLIDLATLELTFNGVFDGPGVEGKDLLDTGGIQDVAPERLLEARFVGVPCLRLLELRYPVHRYFTSVRRREEPSMPEPADTWLAVTRRDYVVRHYELSRAAYSMLDSLLAGETLGQAISRAVKASASELDRLSNNLWIWFHDWAAEGFFQAVELSDR